MPEELLREGEAVVPEELLRVGLAFGVVVVVELRVGLALGVVVVLRVGLALVPVVGRPGVAVPEPPEGTMICGRPSPGVHCCVGMGRGACGARM